MDFERRFGGLRRLYGDDGFARLQAAHVCVVGIGGVGAWAAEALARSAVGRLTFIDPDHIAESNINRQVHALDGALGKAKVLAMAERVRAIHPGCRVQQVDSYLDPDNAADLLPPDADYIVDAIDSVAAKVAIIVECRRRRQPLMCVGGAGGQIDPTQIRIDDLARTLQDPLLAKVRTRLRREHGFPGKGAKMGVNCVYSTEPLRRPQAASCETPPGPAGLQGLNCAGFGSVMSVTASFGLFAAGQVLNQLALR